MAAPPAAGHVDRRVRRHLERHRGGRRRIDPQLSDQPDPTYERRYSGNFGTERVVDSGLDLSHLTAIVACSFAQPTCSPGSVPVAS
jgi:hypothetical protein